MLSTFYYTPEIFQGSIHGALFYGSRMRSIPSMPRYTLSRVPDDDEILPFYPDTMQQMNIIRGIVIEYLQNDEMGNYVEMARRNMRFQNIWYLWCYYSCKEVNMVYDGDNNIQSREIVSILMADFQNKAYDIAASICVYPLMYLFDRPHDEENDNDFLYAFYDIISTARERVSAATKDLDMQEINYFRSIYQCPPIKLWRLDNNNRLYSTGSGSYQIVRAFDRTFMNVVNEDIIDAASPQVSQVPSMSQVPGSPIPAEITVASGIFTDDGRLVCDYNFSEDTFNELPVMRDRPVYKPKRFGNIVDSDFYQTNDVSNVEIEIARFYKRHHKDINQQKPAYCALLSEMYRLVHRINTALNSDDGLDAVTPEDIERFNLLFDVLHNVHRTSIMSTRVSKGSWTFMNMLNNLRLLLNQDDT